MNLRAAKQGVSGKIMLEFLLVAPVLLTITGATIEVANFMRLSQVSTVVSQEAANQAYRQCSSVVRLKNPTDPRYSTTPGTARMQIDDENTLVAVEACLDKVRANSLSTLNNLNQNTSGNAVHVMVARYYPRGTTDQYQSFKSNTAAPSARTASQPKTGNINIQSNEIQQKNKPDSDDDGQREPPSQSNPSIRSFEAPVFLNSSTKCVTYQTANGAIPLIPSEELIKREQIIVGQAVAGYTPLVKFFNLKIIYSGEFRAVTVM